MLNHARHVIDSAHGAGRSGEELFGTGGMSSSGSVQAMERNVARLFSERGPIFGEVDFTQNSILAGASLSRPRQAVLGWRRVGAPSRSMDRLHRKGASGLFHH